jgi:hypothetical protein
MGSVFTGRIQSLSIGKETVWGTPVPTVEAVPHTGAAPDLKLSYVEAATKVGNRGLQGFVRVTQEGNLNVPFEANCETLGWFFKGIMGNESLTPGTPNVHTFTMLNETMLPSWTFLAGFGGYKVYQLPGAVANTLSLQIAPKALVKGTVGYIYKTEIDLAQFFLPAAVSTTTSEIALPNHGLAAGQKVRIYALTGDVLPAPLIAGADYLVVVVDSGHISLTDLSANAITFTTSGTSALGFELDPQDGELPPTNRILTFADGQISIGGSQSFDVRNASIDISNGLSVDDFRLGLGTSLASIPAGKFVFKGKIQVVLNPDSGPVYANFQGSLSTSLVLTLNGTGTDKVVITMPQVMLTQSKRSFADNGITIDYDFDAIVTSGTPATIALYNSRGTVY